MNHLKFIARIFLPLYILLMVTSCVMVMPANNGNHEGWYKNPNNPHHPNSTNPGHGKSHKK
jgi:hypothetical protein